MKKLENKIAIVYGDGAVGSTVAKAFAAEQAKVFFVGRTLSKLKAVANEIISNGGIVEIAEVDALDESAVNNHLDEVIRKAGRVDISFNAIGFRQKTFQSIPLTELSLEDFLLPVTIYSQSHFITSNDETRRWCYSYAHTKCKSVEPAFLRRIDPRMGCYGSAVSFAISRMR